MRAFRRRLGWKLFASYLLIVLVGSVVLWTTAEAVAPAAFARHLSAMVRAGQPPGMMADLFASFLRAMNTALAVAASAAIITAVAISAFVTRRILAVIHLMRQASARIAGGQYSERIPITSDDELGQLAAQFNRMAETLERVEQVRRDLIADVAHELRTPLASIAGYMEAMMDGVISPEPETLNRVRRDAARLQRLVDDLQELSRVEARQVPLQPRPVDVHELVETAAGRIRPQFDAKGVELRIATAAGLPRIVADPDRMLQVLTNLLGNALQYTPTGGRVEVRAGPSDGMVTIAVADTGIGIAPQHLPHVFDRFYRVDRSRTRASGGSGIGLTIVKHLVEAQGGSVRAESPGPGQGSTFTVALPAAP
jgi:histidine kinase